MMPSVRLPHAYGRPCQPDASLFPLCCRLRARVGDAARRPPPDDACVGGLSRAAPDCVQACRARHRMTPGLEKNIPLARDNRVAFLAPRATRARPIRGRDPL
jgi:hypothetical protein